jgi:hypothetical protein
LPITSGCRKLSRYCSSPLGLPAAEVYLLVLGLIAASYAATMEIAKKIFYAKSEF